ncbi:MAG: dTDP-4-dehydrorhamnose reductase [Agarilytica sp.]
MKVLVTGAGQLAWELARTVPAYVELVALTRRELDISDAAQVEKQIATLQVDAVINAAAYTAVDKAETEKEQAMAVNAEGPRILAECCRRHNARLIHVSTDFVFNGKNHRPYDPEHIVEPVGVYGESKAAGEKAIATTMASRWAIIRTAWVYSATGNNFVKTMLRLMADKPQLGIVGDQIGTPTWAHGLAQCCWQTLEKELEGVYHWTDAGVASWYDFACAIQELALELGLLKKAIPIKSIATEDYPTPAKRPAYSVLDKKKILGQLSLPHEHWRAQLKLMLQELQDQQA